MLPTPQLRNILAPAVRHCVHNLAYLYVPGVDRDRLESLQTSLAQERPLNRDAQATAYVSLQLYLKMCRNREEPICPEASATVSRLQRAASRSPWLSPLHRSPDFWTKSIKPISRKAQPNLERLFLDPNLQIVWDEVDRHGDLWITEDVGRIKTKFNEARHLLQEAQGAVTPALLNEMTDIFAKIAGIHGDRGAMISSALAAISLPTNHPLRLSLEQILLFIGHDLAHMIPLLFDIASTMETSPSESASRLCHSILSTLLDPAYEDSLMQILGFPLLILSEMKALAQGAQDGHRPALQKVKPLSIALMTGALLALRLIGDEFGKTVFSKADDSTEPRKQIIWSVGQPQDLTSEGFSFLGDTEAFVWSYPASLVSIIYNSIKNPLRLLSEFQKEETRIPLHFHLEGSDTYRDTQLPNVYWLKHRDSALGFSLNMILEKAFTILENHLSRHFDILPKLVREKLGRVSLAKRKSLIEKLVSSLGIQDRHLVENLLEAYLHPQRLKRMSVGDIHKLASIFQLSGGLRKNQQASTGFGLFGIATLSPMAGAVYENFFIPTSPTGTETVIAIQSLSGLPHNVNDIERIMDV